MFERLNARLAYALLAVAALLAFSLSFLVVADVILTGIVALFLLPAFVDLLRPRFSRDVLRDALHFGLPRVPHSMAHQVTALSDRWVLNAFLTADRVGVYSIGASFGLSMKLFLSAFEYATAARSADANTRMPASRRTSRSSRPSRSVSAADTIAKNGLDARRTCVTIASMNRSPFASGMSVRNR